MNSRRDFLKKAAYVAPAIVTLKAVPAFANTGSTRTQSPFIDLGPPCVDDYSNFAGGQPSGDRLRICR